MFMTFITGSSELNSNVLKFLSGGGEMGQRIRTLNWEYSSLGSINTWPQSLLTSLSIVLHSKFPMFIWWGTDLIQFYNDAYREILGEGGRHPEALGQKGIDCWKEVWPVIKPMIDGVFRGESTWRENQPLPIFRNGVLEDAYWTFSYSPIYIENGVIGGVMVVCSETTQTILNVKRIEESENKLRFAIDAAELATWDYNPVTNKFDGNDRLKAWFGLGPGSDIDLSLAIASIADSDREKVVQSIQAALEYSSGGLYNVNYKIIDPETKDERIVNAKGKAWFNDKKEAYRLNGTLQDITTEIIAREMNDEIQTQIRFAGDRLQLALDAGEIGYYEWLIETQEMKCNNLYKKIFGFSEEHEPTYKEFTSKILAKDVGIRNKAIRKAMEGGGVYNAEYRVEHPNGEIRWVKSFGKAIFDSKKKPFKLIGMILDITEHKQFAEELSKQVQERTAELKQTNSDLLQFAHVASHDLKEPVRKVKIFTGRIRDEFKQELPEKGHVYLEKIQHSTDRMLSMIEGVLMYSTLSNLNAVLEKIDMNVLIDHIQKDLEILIEEKNAAITTVPLPVIEGVPVLIYQLFYNLINNALKFSKNEEAAKITINYGQEQVSGIVYSKITVADNGIGFSNEHVDRMFDPFIRLNSKDKYEGTGLGLALCKKIIDRHNGIIFANGAKDSGAVFTILLPLKTIKS
jgi:PAS domain S-box-containing protein